MTTTRSQRALNLSTSEAAFGEQLRHFALTHGWFGYHPHRSQFSEAGYPDWCFVHVAWNLTLLIELKREIPLWQDKGDTLTWEQRWWLVALARTNIWTYCLRPSDWDLAAYILSGWPSHSHPWHEAIMGHTDPGEWNETLSYDELVLGPRGYAELRIMQTGSGRRRGKRSRGRGN